MSKKMLVPVHGATHWEDGWRNEEDFGENWDRIPKTPGKPMYNKQMDLLESQLIKSVQFHKKLGEGSYGEVFRVSVVLPKAGRRVPMACKMIRPHEANRYSVRTSLNDMRILRYLSHENICVMNDIIGIPDRKTGFPYAVICVFMELCDGDLQSLFDEYSADNPLSNQMLPNNLSRHWFAQALRGLIYLHSKGIVHRDIKAHNILYKVSGNKDDIQSFEQKFLSSVFKLTDFGLSKDTQSIDFVGLPPMEIYRAFKNDADSLCNLLTSLAQSSQSMSHMLGLVIWKGVSLYDIQFHEWFQDNKELFTEPFILRTSQPDIHHQVKHAQYDHWDEIARSGQTPEDYAPFGRAYAPEKVFDPVNQEWVRQELPVQGVPHYTELNPEMQFNFERKQSEH